MSSALRPLTAALRAPVRAMAVARTAPMVLSALRAPARAPLAGNGTFQLKAQRILPQAFQQARAMTDAPVEQRKLYVGNLSFKAGSEDLESHFAQFGVVEEAFIVMDRENPGRSRGFGFVLFENAQDAETAAAKTNESEWMGRFLRVNLANERVSQPRQGGGGRYGGGGGYQGGGGGGFGGAGRED
eukprot:CAMPEP_0206232038 /NCGR_PEP_ID=MMETSP0047_2-20121206/11187_1 /ASSEMBLY_ACC=CAM_ASM_000192 /TAXON_ID=195065 /ORGANISM="Chroomonas mesostigmatica_cf, Strain CCMP1168" /LENGTH=185 /DNA_ID=CAMNT_0053655717 /DNA_START=22 /DNA_END=576 /DNA_ORIENTATION=-